MEFNGLPLLNAKIDKNDHYQGIDIMSFVDEPAVEVNFMYFSKGKKERQCFSLDEEKRIVTGVAMRANYPIYRNQDGKEFYIQFTPEVISDFVQKFMREHKTTNVDVFHDGKIIKDVFLFESFILKDDVKLTNPAFKDIEPGSWMVSYKVENDELWEKVKSGQVKGFSITAYSEMEDAEYEKDYRELNRILNELNTKDISQNMKTSLSKLKIAMSKFRIAMAEAMKVEFSSIETDKGTLYYDGDEFEQGIQVWVRDADESLIMPENGDYGYGNKIAVVEDGVVVDIREATPANTEMETDTDPEDVPEVPELETDSSGDATTESLNALRDSVEGIAEVLQDAIEDIKSIDEAVQTLEGEFKKVRKEPVKPPIDTSKMDTKTTDSPLANRFRK